MWRLGGEQYENIIWPCKISPYLKKVSRRAWNIRWTVSIRNLSLEKIINNEKFRNISLPENWLSEFGIKELYTNDLTTNINYSPNFIRINLLNNE